MARKYIKNKDNKRFVCSVCGERPVRKKGKLKNGGIHYGTECQKCHQKRYNQGVYAYRNTKAEVCERCGFIPEHPRQLDVHHIDGDRRNNDPDNLRTLCANCHRLEHITSPLFVFKEVKTND